MYVMSVDDGYILIERDETGKYYIVEYPNGIPYSLKIKKKTQNVKIMPVGQIVIDRYNTLLKLYLDKGGTIQECLRYHKSKRLIKINGSTPPPTWIYSDPPYDSLSDIQFEDDLSYINTAFIPFMNAISPVFDIDSLDELYLYDKYRLRESDLTIKECSDCGKAFIARTTAIRCPACRQDGKGEQLKYQNRKNDPYRSMAYKIIDRNNPNRRKTDITYSDYQGKLQNIIYAHSKDENSVEFIQSLDKMDKRYFSLCKCFHYNNSSASAEIYEQWNNEKTQFPCVDNMDEWLTKWEKIK